MARFVRSSSTRPIARSNRKFAWIGGVSVAFSDVTLATGVSIVVSSFDTRTAGQLHDFTIMRVRGLLSVVSDQVAANEHVHGAFGAAVVNGEALDAGVGSIPTPFTESFDDRWFYHTYWAAPFRFIAGAAMTQIASQTIIDGKAMRKVNQGDVIVFVIENGNNSQGALFTLNQRVGVKLH